MATGSVRLGASRKDDGGNLRERQKLKRRSQILDAAETLFNGEGYDRTTIGEIAKLAEVSAATIHNYYQGKGEILLALVERTDEAILQEIRKMAALKPTDPTDTMNRALEMITVQSLKRLQHHVWRHAIAISITREDPEFGVGFSAAHKRFIGALSLIVQSLIERGALLKTVDPRVFASVLYKIQHALFIELIVETTIDLKRYRKTQQEHINLVLSGLVPHRRPLAQ